MSKIKEDRSKLSEAEKPKSWWETVPGILTGVAAIIGAVSGAIVAYASLPTQSQPSPKSKQKFLVLEAIEVHQPSGAMGESW
jgi:hypothetical protein